MVEISQALQNQLFAVAYKMTGRVALSQDIRQEVIAKYLEKERPSIENPKAYLIRMVINTTLSYLKNEQKERKNYVGVWLPEPILQQADAIDNSLDLSYGMTVLLSKLNPKERAVFILRTSFDLPYRTIAEMLELTTANCRKIYQRTTPKIKQDTTDKVVQNQEKKKIIQAFLAAAQKGNFDTLVQALREDIAIYSDGGGKVAAAINPLFGLDVCLKFLLGIYRKLDDTNRIELQMINGEQGFVVFENEQIVSVAVLEMEGGQLSKFYFIRNPDKIN